MKEIKLNSNNKTESRFFSFGSINASACSDFANSISTYGDGKTRKAVNGLSVQFFEVGGRLCFHDLELDGIPRSYGINFTLNGTTVYGKVTTTGKIIDNEILYVSPTNDIFHGKLESENAFENQLTLFTAHTEETENEEELNEFPDVEESSETPTPTPTKTPIKVEDEEPEYSDDEYLTQITIDNIDFDESGIYNQRTKLVGIEKEKMEYAVNPEKNDYIKKNPYTGEYNFVYSNDVDIANFPNFYIPGGSGGFSYQFIIAFKKPISIKKDSLLNIHFVPIGVGFGTAGGARNTETNKPTLYASDKQNLSEHSAISHSWPGCVCCPFYSYSADHSVGIVKASNDFENIKYLMFGGMLGGCNGKPNYRMVLQSFSISSLVTYTPTPTFTTDPNCITTENCNDVGLLIKSKDKQPYNLITDDSPFDMEINQMEGLRYTKTSDGFKDSNVSIRFDGNCEYLYSDDTDNFDGIHLKNNDFTIEAWIKLIAPPTPTPTKSISYSKSPSFSKTPSKTKTPTPTPTPTLTPSKSKTKSPTPTSFACLVFTATGSTQTYTVPSGVGKIFVQMWGAGGSSGRYQANKDAGGAGGYAEGYISVTAGEKLLIGVGETTSGTDIYTWHTPGYSIGGSAGSGGVGNHRGAGAGGGLSGIFSENILLDSAIMIAGGGGGAAGSGTALGAGGGGGGGEVGLPGTRYENDNGGGGTGGTQTSPGIGCGSGSNLNGGTGNTNGDSSGGGGGAGWFGGGGGCGLGGQDSSGGGGSGYLSDRVSEGKMVAGDSGKQGRLNTKAYKPSEYVCDINEELLLKAGNPDNHGLIIFSIPQTGCYETKLPTINQDGYSGNGTINRPNNGNLATDADFNTVTGLYSCTWNESWQRVEYKFSDATKTGILRIKLDLACTLPYKSVFGGKFDYYVRYRETQSSDWIYLLNKQLSTINETNSTNYYHLDQSVELSSVDKVQIYIKDRGQGSPRFRVYGVSYKCNLCITPTPTPTPTPSKSATKTLTPTPVFSWYGNGNGSHGNVGIVKSKMIKEGITISHLLDGDIVQYVGHYEGTLVLTNKQSVYYFGRVFYSTYNLQSFYNPPKKIEFPPGITIKKIFGCGGESYTWRFYYIDNNNNLYENLVTTDITEANIIDTNVVQVSFNNKGGPDGNAFTTGATTVYLKEDGTVWGYGKGSWGELARGSLSNVPKENPVQIAGPGKSYITENEPDLLGDVKIKKVEICGYFTLFLDENNDLYQTGYQPQIGWPPKSKPEKILSDVKDMNGSSGSLGVITNDGSVYTRGNTRFPSVSYIGRSGYLGELAIAYDATIDGNSKAKEIHCDSFGGNFLTEDNKLYGYGSYGNVVGTNGKYSGFAPEIIDENVKSFTIGIYHMIYRKEENSQISSPSKTPTPTKTKTPTLTPTFTCPINDYPRYETSTVSSGGSNHAIGNLGNAFDGDDTTHTNETKLTTPYQSRLDRFVFDNSQNQTPGKLRIYVRAGTNSSHTRHASLYIRYRKPGGNWIYLINTNKTYMPYWQDFKYEVELDSVDRVDINWKDLGLGMISYMYHYIEFVQDCPKLLPTLTPTTTFTPSPTKTNTPSVTPTATPSASISQQKSFDNLSTAGCSDDLIIIKEYGENKDMLGISGIYKNSDFQDFSSMGGAYNRFSDFHGNFRRQIWGCGMLADETGSKFWTPSVCAWGYSDYAYDNFSMNANEFQFFDENDQVTSCIGEAKSVNFYLKPEIKVPISVQKMEIVDSLCVSVKDFPEFNGLYVANNTGSRYNLIGNDGEPLASFSTDGTKWQWQTRSNIFDYLWNHTEIDNINPNVNQNTPQITDASVSVTGASNTDDGVFSAMFVWDAFCSEELNKQNTMQMFNLHDDDKTPSVFEIKYRPDDCECALQEIDYEYYVVVDTQE